ncbi:hypothetical protein B6V75_11750 [Thioclava sp. F1Mire-8]|uniref:DUF6404 family protein n=1 Tax=Thioclava sp. F1Mire-8 TaxID=1973006 RepID=UPI000B5436C2|nr:DUF6404 family protein [Thioclava sp. F1Mire-8]OWY02555.1 hypothetical protein B6V75_11750 [Thioclava sp. F1Mire-8]
MYLNNAETHRRYDAALAELRARGVFRSTRPSMSARVLHWLGFEPRPIPYLDWKQNLLIFGAGFAVAQLLVDHLLSATEGMSYAPHLVTLVISALAFGALMALWQIHRKNKLGLSDWDDL